MITEYQLHSAFRPSAAPG